MTAFVELWRQGVNNNEKISSEELKRMVIETIDYSKETNYKRVFDLIWSNSEDMFPDNVDIDTSKENINKLLQTYTQMVVMESVNLTLNALEKTGTLGSVDRSNE